jgi:hypothetical protein
MKNQTAATAGKAIALIAKRLDQIEARIIATDLCIAAIMEHSPDLPAVLNSLEESLDPKYLSAPPTPVQVAAQDRTRQLLRTHRGRTDPD